jgi:hypothetical protein
MATRHDLVNRGKREIFMNNLIGGMAWAFGAIIGTALLLFILGLIAQNVNFIPIVGEFVSGIIDYVINTNQNLKNS